jgi:hypothetical protein
MHTGIIEIKVRLFLNYDVNETEAQEIIDEMDYQFKHSTIGNTEIIEHELI